MSKRECTIFVVFMFFCFGFYGILCNKNKQIENYQKDLSEMDRTLSDVHVRIFSNEEKISVLEDSINSKDKKWSKVKKIREIIIAEQKESGLYDSQKINEITELASSVFDYSEQLNIPPELILAIIRRESHFNPLAVSSTGAQGLMQIVPSTARECAEDLGKKNFSSFKIRDNVHMGSWYILKMLNRFKENEDLAIKAYNVGPVMVEKYLSGENKVLPPETEKYAKDVAESMKKFQDRGL